MAEFIEIVAWCSQNDSCDSAVNEEYAKLSMGRTPEDVPRLEFISSVQDLEQLASSDKDIIPFFLPTIIVDETVVNSMTDDISIIEVLDKIANLFDPTFLDKKRIKCLLSSRDVGSAAAITEAGYGTIWKSGL